MHINVVLLISHVRLFATPWTAARQASLSFFISRSLLKLMSIQSVMPSNHLILCHPLLLLPSIFSSVRVFSNESALHIRGQSIRISSVLSKNIQGWFPLGFSSTTVWKHQFLSDQPSLWSNFHIHTWLLENHSFDYMDLCRQVMSLLFNVLSRFV